MLTKNNLSLGAFFWALCFWQLLVRIEEEPNYLLVSAEPMKDNSQLVYSSLRSGNGFEMENPMNEITGKLRRRVTGFVPMRGKKDQFGEQAPREMDQEATISRLAALENQVTPMDAPSSLAQGGEQLSGANSNWQPVVAVPRQFFYQMTNHRQEPQQQQLQQLDNGWQGASSAQAMNGLWGQQATNSMLMEAKLRRAFHPMRGKRLPQQAVLFED